jgi:type I restriction enzyme, S subunit
MKFPKKPLGEICEFIRGVTFTGNEVSSKQLDGYLPILRAGNISNELNIRSNLVWVPQKRVSSEQFLQINDLVICMASGSPEVLGKTAKLTNPYVGSVGAFCGIIRVNKADPSFIAYWFKSLDFYRWRDEQARGVNIQNLRPSEIQEIEISLPPLPEQQRIATILGNADRLRRLRQYASLIKETYLQSVFLDMFGNPETNPMGWAKEKVGSIITNIRYGTGSPPKYVEKGIPFIRATNIKKGTVNPEEMVFITDFEAKKIPKCMLKEGDLILVRSGVNSGDCAIIPNSYAGAYAAYDLIVEIHFPYNYYFNFFINSLSGKRIINTLSRRAGQPHINSDQVKSILIPLPERGLILQFVGIMQKLLKVNIQLSESERQVEHLFQTLMKKAFQGEL